MPKSPSQTTSAEGIPPSFVSATISTMFVNLGSTKRENGRTSSQVRRNKSAFGGERVTGSRAKEQEEHRTHNAGHFTGTKPRSVGHWTGSVSGGGEFPLVRIYLLSFLLQLLSFPSFLPTFRPSSSISLSSFFFSFPFFSYPPFLCFLSLSMPFSFWFFPSVTLLGKRWSSKSSILAMTGVLESDGPSLNQASAVFLLRELKLFNTMWFYFFIPKTEMILITPISWWD